MEIANVGKYRKDLDKLLEEADWVKQSLLRNSLGDTEFLRMLVDDHGTGEEQAKEFMKSVKPFATAYQHWYSEALVLVKQLLPERLADFVKLYEKPKTRKDITFENYRLEDACQGLRVSGSMGKVLADISSAYPLLEQQVAIVEAIKRRFDSSLFEIKQTVQADLFDSELDSARHLLKSGFSRAAGVIAGVVLEGHLKEIRDKHQLGNNLKTITPIIDKMKSEGIIDLAQYRQLQYLGDIRNNASHKGTEDPTPDQIEDLIAGTNRVIKNIF